MKKIETGSDVDSKEKRGSSGKRVPAVRRAMAILWELADSAVPMSLSHIARVSFSKISFI